MTQTFYDGRKGQLTRYNPVTGLFTTDPIPYQDADDSISHQPTKPALEYYEVFDNFCRAILADVNRAASHKFVFDNSRLDHFGGIGFIQGISATPNKPDTDFVMYIVRDDHAGNGISIPSDVNYRYEIRGKDSLPHFQAEVQKAFRADQIRVILEIDKKP